MSKDSEDSEKLFPGADENTPSRSQYFSWISNTNEGATEAQTIINLEFFKWLKDEYGMQLDIYAWDAGNLDGKGVYGSIDSERFKRHYPNGVDTVYEKARSFGCRFGVWCGPDGFGNSPEEEQARIDMMVRLCRDYDFMLFKMDSVCGQLRTEKQDAFVRMMEECRRYSPDLILLNHRLNLGKGLLYATTFLWEGAETYIDVHMPNRQTATHHRVGALSRGLVPDLKRLTEDHGVCISSCPDYWEDDLILQAFNRCLILAPEIYGNPWLLRDDEFPKLARIYNLHRRYRDILVKGVVLPEKDYGPFAVSRGDGNTRFITLRNLDWNPVKYRIKLDASIGLMEEGDVELRQFHPSERIMGEFGFGSEIEVEVLPFRSCLLMATTTPTSEIGIHGCDYEVVRDTPGKPVIVKLLGFPGSEASVTLSGGDRKFTGAKLDGENVDSILDGKPLLVKFAGTPLRKPWHRKLGDLKPCDVPDDAEALYEATCFAADNNALEVRALLRSGPTEIPQVQKARDALFGQRLFIDRGLWDKNLFDGDQDTAFYVCRRWDGLDVRVNGGSLRIDLGEAVNMDRLIIRTGSESNLQPFKSDENIFAQVSADLMSWTRVSLMAGKDIVGEMPAEIPIRYIRVNGCPSLIMEIEGYRDGLMLDRSKWRASNLFSPYFRAPAVAAWSLSFTLDEAAKGSYFAIAINGRHGVEGAYAAIRVDGRPVGAPDRSVSYPSNAWEVPVRPSDSNYTYYVPVTEEMVGKKIDAVVLGLRGGVTDIEPEVWITAYPIPFEARELILTQAL